MPKTISDPKAMEKFTSWMRENCVEPDSLGKVDIDAEFGKDMSFNEAVGLAIQKFPTLWKSESIYSRESKPKQIVFVKDLVQKISDGKVQVTYRTSPKVGTYYVLANRFKQKSDSSRLLIEFYRTDRVNAYNLTDEEAQLAGVDTADNIRGLFEKWYGKPIPMLYRNWFKVCSN
ncbi:MAG TPA: hypothetical protein VNE86_02820 [Nitrososphaerales archaeon]|nr:hypothetical protein [Nitrososphaerales archaeon]